MNNRKKKLFLFNCFQPEGKRYYFCEIMLFNFYYVKKTGVKTNEKEIE